MVEKNRRGFVYIFTNERFGECKIGFTKDIPGRLRALNTGVPVPFKCHFAVEVEDMHSVEAKLHAGLAGHRVKGGSEFFDIAPERAMSLLQLTEHKVYKPKGSEDIKISPAVISKRLNIKAAGLSKGNILTFSRDEKVVVLVHTWTLVSFNGEEMSLAKATEKAFRKIGEKWRTGSAAEYWYFDQDLLSERILKLDPVGSRRSFSFTDAFPVIARLIKTQNKQTKKFASHAQIVGALLQDPEAKKLLNVSLQLTRFKTAKEVAANQVAWWSQQITQQTNPFTEHFERRKSKNAPYEYWAKEIGKSPNL